MTLNCTGNPETTRIDNFGTAQITLISLSSLADQTGAEPYVVNRPLGAGRTVIYRSNTGATSGTILTTNELYTNSRGNQDGLVLETSAGQLVVPCAGAPTPSPSPSPSPNTGPTPPSQLRVTVSCRANPETTRVENIGVGTVTITSVSALQSGKSVATSRKLGPGSTVIFRSGSGATSGTILTTQFLYNDAGYQNEGARVQVSTGKTFTDRCDAAPPPPSPRPSPSPSPAPQPSLAVTAGCYGNPETIAVRNTGSVAVALSSVGSLHEPRSNEPFGVSRTLQPGQSVTYQAGAGATSNVLTRQYIFDNNVGTAEGARVRTTSGAVFSDRCG